MSGELDHSIVLMAVGRHVHAWTSTRVGVCWCHLVSGFHVATSFQYLSLASCVKRCETSWLTSCMWMCNQYTFQQKSCEDLAYSLKNEIRWNVVASKWTPQKGLTNTMTQIVAIPKIASNLGDLAIISWNHLWLPFNEQRPPQPDLH